MKSCICVVEFVSESPLPWASHYRSATLSSMSDDSARSLSNSPELRDLKISGTDSVKDHIGWLDGLRGFAALWVMIGHARTEALTSGLTGTIWPKVLGFVNEGFGVPVFIVLSGFLLTSPLVDAPSSKWKGPVAFMTRRAKRIYPAYIATILIVLLLVQLSPYWSSDASPRWKDALPISGPCLAIHLLMIHNLFPGMVHKIDPPMWTLAVEWEIYFAFAFLLVPILLKKGLKLYVLAGFIFAAIAIVNGAEMSMLVLCFIFGSVASHLVKSSKGKAEQIWNSSLTTYGGLGILLVALGVDRLHFHSLETGFIGLGTAVLLVRVCHPLVKDWFVASARSILGRALSRKLGWLSYSLYLVHFVVLSGINAYAIKAGFSPSIRTVAVLVVGPILSVAIAYLMAATVEYRFVNRAATARA